MKYIVQTLIWHPTQKWKWCEVSTHNWYVVAIMSYLNSGGTLRIRKQF